MATPTPPLGPLIAPHSSQRKKGCFDKIIKMMTKCWNACFSKSDSTSEVAPPRVQPVKRRFPPVTAINYASEVRKRSVAEILRNKSDPSRFSQGVVITYPPRDLQRLGLSIETKHSYVKDKPTVDAPLAPVDVKLYKVRNPIYLKNHPGVEIAITHTDLFATDAPVFVNAANLGLAGGGGIDGAIHDMGNPHLSPMDRSYTKIHPDLATNYPKAHARLGTDYRATKGGFKEGWAAYIEGMQFVVPPRDPKTRQPTKKDDDLYIVVKDVIVVAGPSRGPAKAQEDAEQLYNCYRNIFEMANLKGHTKVAIPSIATGIFRYPVEVAAEVFLKAAQDFYRDNPRAVLKKIDIHMFNPFNINPHDEMEDWNLVRRVVESNPDHYSLNKK